MIRLASALALVLLSAGTAAAQGRPATCSRDLFQNEAAMRLRQTRMQQVATADQATQCKAWRDHVAFLQSSRAVFATCQTGREREENVGQMDQALSEYRVLIGNRCKTR
ncbi:hypothetical protein [Bosea sp. BK604]|uniref:hypothetical protein n=1 Tax=Bosea sp. BK604 TaxID=2512180 RepID=UPI0010446EFD|nr:hypothetical protein [Bosea sp. BK604]TCR64290.1 hypothetical protein EV560_107379 [Bosea sp. BK604]